MGRPIHADGRQTRQTILDAALELFAEKGYFGTSLRDIAAVVGVRESALYNYFKGKEALFSALIDAAHEHKAEQLAGLLEAPVSDVRSVLERLTTLVLDNFCAPRQQQLFRVLMSDGMRLAREGRIDLIERMTSGAAPFHALMRRLIVGGGLKAREPELLTIEFMGPLLLWRHWHAIRPDDPLIADRRSFVRDHVDHFMQGAGTVAAARTVRVAPKLSAHPSRVAIRRRHSRAKVAS
jgi:AcrR family transcriptional regulator